MTSTIFPFEIPHRSFKESAQFVIDRLEQSPIRSLKNRKNRFMRLCRAVLEGDLSRILDKKQPEDRVLAQAILDVQEMAWVLTVLRDEVWKKRFAEVVRRAGKDPPLPNVVESPGRNAQLELFAGAIAERSCLNPKPVSPGPEWLVSDGEGHAGAIECKRVRSERQLWSNLTKANDQFRTVGVRGFVIIDVTLLDKSHDGLDLGEHPYLYEKITEWQQATIKNFMIWLKGKGEHLYEIDRVGMIILYSPFVGQICRNGQVNALSAYHPFMLFPPWPDHPAYSTIEPLVRRFMDGAPGLHGHV